MIKKVNITTTLPVRTVTPILNANTTYHNLRMNTGDIYRCICMRAFVEEVLATGVVVKLDSSNYNRINGPVPAEVANINVAKKEIIDDKPEQDTVPEAPINEDEDPSIEAVSEYESAEEDTEEEAPTDIKEVVETIRTEADDLPKEKDQTTEKAADAPVEEDVSKTSPKPVQHSNKKRK